MAYMLARMSKASDGALEATLTQGIPFLNGGVPDVKAGSGGFAHVLAKLNGEHYRWMKWVAAHRAEAIKARRRMADAQIALLNLQMRQLRQVMKNSTGQQFSDARDKVAEMEAKKKSLDATARELLFEDSDISALKDLDQGNLPNGTSRQAAYANALNELNAYNEGMLQIALESHLIDQDTFDLMKGQPYVPFYRVMEDEQFQGPTSSAGLTNQKAWEKLKGSKKQLNADLLENMLLNWSHLLLASGRNRAALATVDAASNLMIAYKVPAAPNVKVSKDAIKVMRDGKTEHWMVEDPHLLDALSALTYTTSPLMKPIIKMKQILTMAVTVNPTFKIRNLIRDSVSAIAQSELGYNPWTNVKSGWKLTASDSQIYASMLAGGGTIKFGSQESTDRLRQQIEKLGGQVLNKTTAQNLMDRAGDVWNIYSEFGDRTENVNRAALYDKLIKMGKSHAEASFEARDLMDFSMGGTMPLVRFLTQTVPFLNARLVGLDKLGRAAVADPRKFGTMAAAVAIASVALMMMYGDDDDWKKREDWDRDAYWWFKIGGTAFRIPKPFEVGAIGTMAERTFELMFEKEMTNKRFRERIAHMFSQTFAFDPVPQAVKPLLDVYSNKDSFTKRAIESQSDQRMRPQDRYNERTSEVARMLGKLGLPEPSQLIKGEYVGLSPKQIDHLIKGYFSWVGVTATAAADAVIRPAMGKGERPDMRLKDMFMVGNFVETLPTGSSRYVTQMYEQARQINQAYASYREALKSGEMEKAKDIKAANADNFRNRLAIAHAEDRLSELNQEAKKIEASRTISSGEKRRRLDAISERRGAIAKLMSLRMAH